MVKMKQNGTLSNAILFFCEDELTSKNVLILSALLLEYQTFELFSEQSAEFKKVESGVDLDIKMFPKGDERIKVADSNEIVVDAYEKPVNLENKVYILQNFDDATEEAQNKLLKVLEEPPKNVYFLLSAKSEERVLPTIKSRCDKIKINPLSDEEIKSICKDDLAVVLGNGYIGKTLSLSRHNNLKEIIDFGVSLFCDLKSSKQVVVYSKKFLAFKGDLKLILEVMSLCIEDILKMKCESESLCRLKSYFADLKEVEPEFSVKALCEISKLISRLQEKVEFNANMTVAVDNFLLKILEVKYICK
ncbi:MAG: hypothetical protein K2K31_02440 [Clostridia bacterium]|nr:hypothetical protein [Clostridia bacterium]